VTLSSAKTPDLVVAAVAAAAAALVRTDLASEVSSKGAGMVAYDPLLNYPDGTVGASLKDVNELIPFCLGDGVTTKFLSDGSPIYRTDSLGRVLLTQGPRTNLGLWSEDMTQTIAAGGTTTTTATTITDTSVAAASGRRIPLSAVAADSKNYTFSAYIAKQAGVAFLQYQLVNGTNVNTGIAIDCATGEVAPGAAGYLAVQVLVEDAGTLGWHVSVQVKNNGTNTGGNLLIYPAWAVAVTHPYTATPDVTLTGPIGITKVQVEETPTQSVVMRIEGDSISSNLVEVPWGHQLGLIKDTSVILTAVDGAKTSDMVTRFDTYKNSGGTHFAVLGGVNDITGGIAAATTQANLTYMWATAKALGFTVVCFTLTPWKYSAAWNASRQTETESMNTWIRAEAEAKGYVLIDTYTLLDDPGDPGAMLPAYVKPDYTHPNAFGGQAIAREVRRLVPLPLPYTHYIATGAAAVTVTDYSLSSGIATISPAPGAGDLLEGLANIKTLIEDDLQIIAVGKGISITEGTNAKMGVTAAMTAGSIVVSTTKVTANSRIFLTAQNTGGTAGALRVSARTPGTSFTITSTSGTDTSTVAWMIVEPL
jgi:hypothetical protein